MTLKERLKKFDLLPEITEEDASSSPELVALFNDLSKELSIKIASIPVWFEYTKDEQKSLILNYLNNKLNEEFSEIKLNDIEKERISAMFMKSVYGFGSLDFLIAHREIKAIMVEACNNILLDLNGEIVKSDVIIDEKQLESLIMRLKEISGKNSPVISFRFNNLLVTILSEPVSSQKLFLKKVSDQNYNFDYLEGNEIVNSDIAQFLKTAFLSKKKFLISAPQNSGKTMLLNAFLNEIKNDKRILLYENAACVNTENQAVVRYNVEGLSVEAQLQLIKSSFMTKPEYVFSDVDDIGFNIELADNILGNTGFAAIVTADSPMDALEFFTFTQNSRLKCSEKYAKIKFTKYFDYVIQLEKQEDTLILKTIIEVSNNTGVPVLTERLTLESGQFKYDFPASEIIIPPADADSLDDTPKKLSFSARFQS